MNVTRASDNGKIAINGQAGLESRARRILRLMIPLGGKVLVSVCNPARVCTRQMMFPVMKRKVAKYRGKTEERAQEQSQRRAKRVATLKTLTRHTQTRGVTTAVTRGSIRLG